jgi:alanine racemase
VPRPILATIELDAMRRNLARAREAARGRFVWAVVKANAYGHGLTRALRAFAEADGLALLDFDEARRARAAGWRKPILLLEGCFEAADLAVCSELDLTTVVHCGEQLAMLEHHRPVRPVSVHLKINTGMNRLGFRPQGAVQAYERLRGLHSVRELTLMMHFANADRPHDAAGPSSAAEQAEAFEGVTAEWPEPRSLANSAALFLLPEVGGDSVRPGISLYGGATDEHHPAASLGLRAAMVLTSEVIGVQTLEAGSAVGYGARFVAQRRTRIGVVACGYADGYPRHAPDGAPVIVAGVRVPLAGRVSMDMITVDLTHVPEAGVGSHVELWGERLPIDEVANAAGTVGYELMCALAPRVPVVESG